MRIHWLLAVILATACPAPAAAEAVKVGKPAPQATLSLINGQTLKISELRGQVVVLNFWATWCGPCKVELPTLDRYYRLRKQYGLRVFAVTTEDSLPLNRLKKLFEAMAIDSVRKLRGPYSALDGVPTNIVIDRAGVVRYAKAGAFDLESLNDLLVPLLKEPVPPPSDSSRTP